MCGQLPKRALIQVRRGANPNRESRAETRGENRGGTRPLNLFERFIAYNPRTVNV